MPVSSLIHHICLVGTGYQYARVCCSRLFFLGISFRFGLLFEYSVAEDDSIMDEEKKKVENPLGTRNT